MKSTKNNDVKSFDTENPEWTRADFLKARPAAEVLPLHIGFEPAAELLRRRGRPLKADREVN